MRFGKFFKRSIGGTDPTLGTDSAPSGAPADKVNDNQLSWRLKNNVGFPIQRIAVGYHGPAMALSLQAHLYVYDDATGFWFIASEAKLVPGKIVWFDQPTLADANDGTTAGCLDLCLVVDAAGGDPAGTYTFTMGADLSNAP